MSIVYGCVAFLIGIAFIVVGAVVVRKAHPTSGYLFIAAGAVTILYRCCFGGATPEALINADIDFELIQMIMLLKTLMGAGQLLLVGVLLAAGLVTLAKQVPEEPA